MTNKTNWNLLIVPDWHETNMLLSTIKKWYISDEISSILLLWDVFFWFRTWFSDKQQKEFLEELVNIMNEIVNKKRLIYIRWNWETFITDKKWCHDYLERIQPFMPVWMFNALKEWVIKLYHIFESNENLYKKIIELVNKSKYIHEEKIWWKNIIFWHSIQWKDENWEYSKVLQLWVNYTEKIRSHASKICITKSTNISIESLSNSIIESWEYKSSNKFIYIFWHTHTHPTLRTLNENWNIYEPQYSEKEQILNILNFNWLINLWTFWWAIDQRDYQKHFILIIDPDKLTIEFINWEHFK